MRKGEERALERAGSPLVCDLGRVWGESRRKRGVLGTALLKLGRRKHDGLEIGWRTTFGILSEGRALSPNQVPNGAGAEARSRGTGLAAGPGGHPPGSALQSPSPRCRRRQQPLPPPLPNHPSDTRAAASQHVGRDRYWNRGGRLGTNTDRARHRGCRRGGRRGRLARTQIVEAEAAATVVPSEPREEGLLEAAPDRKSVV